MIFVLDKHWVFNLTAFLFGIKERVGFNRGNEGIFLTKKIKYGKINHEIYYYLDLGKSENLKINYKDHKMDLFYSKKDKEFANNIWKKYNLKNKKVAILAPGGGNIADKFSYMRLIPINQYIKLIKELKNKKYHIILVGAKNDLSLGKKITQEIKSKMIINLIDKTTIAQTAALAKSSNCGICNDAGAIHILASANKKIFSMFTITHPKKKAPLWDESKAIWLNEKDYCKKCELSGDYTYYNEKINKIFKKKIDISKLI
ncbi:MAG: glycosyltransferase family 9 protein, partial [Nanoarchaeota archaeon]|nr:glycosyltransferase family 9 protein [Nanoarchaeota archaeon]